MVLLGTEMQDKVKNIYSSVNYIFIHLLLLFSFSSGIVEVFGSLFSRDDICVKASHMCLLILKFTSLFQLISFSF